MAQTGKLGTADSQLANLQLAFTTADPSPPSIDTQSGRLGGQLGDTVLAFGGVIGASVIHLAAESVLAAAQSADPAPTFAPHALSALGLGRPGLPTGRHGTGLRRCRRRAARDYHPERPARKPAGRSGSRPRRAGRRGRHSPLGRKRAGDRADGGPRSDVRAPPVSGVGLGRPGRPAWRRRAGVRRCRGSATSNRRSDRATWHVQFAVGQHAACPGRGRGWRRGQHRLRRCRERLVACERGDGQHCAGVRRFQSTSTCRMWPRWRGRGVHSREHLGRDGCGGPQQSRHRQRRIRCQLGHGGGLYGRAGSGGREHAEL